VRTTLRHLGTGETDAELLTLCASGGAATWGGTWAACGLPLPHCAFHAVTGCPCPTCGATRCVAALVHGRVGEALGWNPLVFACLAALAVVNVYAATVLMTGRPRARVSLSALEGRIVRVGCVCLLGANWLWVLHRGV